MRRPGDDLERVEVRSRRAWRRWLRENHRQQSAIWLVTYKRDAAPKWFLPYDAIVEEALCFGWIDSLPRSLDDRRSMRLVAPRNPASAWSAVNKARIEKLIAARKMTKSGLVVVERAKASGSWNKLDGVETEVVPRDLARALASRGRAREYFNAFPRSSKRIILEWISNAKRPETRARRIVETATLAARNRRANHWRQPR